MSMSVDGLISGMDTTSLINQLIQAEAGPQTALKKRLTAAETSASAYRTVNTAFAAVRAAAEALHNAAAWTPVKATSNSSSVAVSASSSAITGTLSFKVQSLASSHAVVNTNAAWTSTTAAYGAGQIQVFAADGVTSKGTITIGGTGSIADAADAINASSLGLSAAVVQVKDGATPEYALQITAKTTGVDSKFVLSGSGTFGVTKAASNATLLVGDLPGQYSVQSSTNTFASLMPGATITVNKADPAAEVTVTVAADPDAVAAKVQTLVDAVNSAVTTVKQYTNNAKGSTAALKGDYSVNQLAGQLLDAVSFAIGGKSPATVGIELSKDGKKVEFTKATFLDALKADPTLARTMAAGTAAGPGPDAIPGNSDDVAASGVAGRLLDVAKRASDSTTGTLLKMAEGQDGLAEDIQDKIEAWDLRLIKRKEMLTRQFTAMETALSALKNQSTWLAGQINGLPKWS
jgi:flagellar hook-associated protein 2